MRLAAGWLAVAALAAAQPLQQAGSAKEQDTADAAQHPPSPPANRSEEASSSLVDVVMQLVVDLSRLAMELHHSGGSREVTAQRINVADESSLLLTFHRSADAAASLLTPEGQMSRVISVLTSQAAKVDKWDDVAGRVMDYESSAEASLSDPLPLTIKPLPPPVVPIAEPVVHVAEGSSAVVTVDGVPGQKGKVGRDKKQPKKGGEVSERSGEDARVSRTVVALLSDRDGEDPYGLRFLLHFLEAIHRVVDVVKSLVGRLRGFRGGSVRRGDDGRGRFDDGKGDGGRGVGSRASGGRGDGVRGGGGRRGADGKGKHKAEPGFAQDVADRVASLLGALEQAKGAQAKSAGRKASGR